MRGDTELAALVAALDGDDQLQVELGHVVGKFRRRRERAINAQEAAELLPVIGYEAFVERKGCHPSTAYRRMHRSREKTFAQKISLAKE